MSRDGSFLSREGSRDTSYFSRESSFMSRGTPRLSRENTPASRSTMKESLDEVDEDLREMTPVNASYLANPPPRDSSTPVLGIGGGPASPSLSLMPPQSTTSYLIQQTSLNGNSTTAVAVCGCPGCPAYQQPLTTLERLSGDDYEGESSTDLGTATSAAELMQGSYKSFQFSNTMSFNNLHIP